MDGGNSWGPIYQKEVKDESNTEILEVINVIEQSAAGPIDLRCRVTREDTPDCTVIKGMISCERKG
jgi:hypothetical protein